MCITIKLSYVHFNMLYMKVTLLHEYQCNPEDCYHPVEAAAVSVAAASAGVSSAAA